MFWCTSSPITLTRFYYLVIVKAAEQNTRPSQAQIRTWLKEFEALTRILKIFWDKDSVATLEFQRQKVGDIMDALGMDARGRDKTR